jgi:hypothetical protein
LKSEHGPAAYRLPGGCSASWSLARLGRGSMLSGAWHRARILGQHPEGQTCKSALAGGPGAPRPQDRLTQRPGLFVFPRHLGNVKGQPGESQRPGRALGARGPLARCSVPASPPEAGRHAARTYGPLTAREGVTNQDCQWPAGVCNQGSIPPG